MASNLLPKLARFSAVSLTLLLLLIATFPLGAGAQTQAAAPLPPVEARDERFGVVQAVQSPQLAANAGVSWERIIFPWSLIQKNSPNEWNELYFSDQQIRNQAAKGITQVGVIIYTPQWASPDPPRAQPGHVPRNLFLPHDHPDNYWGQFVRKLATRHRGVVDHWVIWNEPDLFDPTIRYTFAGSYEQYFELLKVAYLNIKEVNPKAKVILAGLAYWWDKEYGRTPYLLGLTEILSNDPLRKKHDDYFDIAAVHTYGSPLNSYAVPMLARQWLEARGMKKPIWITESNVVPYNDPVAVLPAGYFHATLDEQASYVIQSYALAVAAGVERHAIYKMVDDLAEDGQFYGLVRNDGSVRPAYAAYQVAATYFAGVKSAYYTWPGLAGPPSAEQVKQILDSNLNRPQFVWPAQVSQVVMERGDRRTTVVWNNSPELIETRVPAESREATLVTRYGRTSTIVAKDGAYVLELPESRNNADPRDPSLYMVGGEPFIIDEAVAPLPDRARSRIQAVWPLDGKPVQEAEQANITAQLLLRGTTEPVPCRWSPVVELWGRENGGRSRFVALGVKRFIDESGRRYPVWDFNGVDVAAARDPEGKKFIEFEVGIPDVPTDSQKWTYGGEKATEASSDLLPSRSCG